MIKYIYKCIDSIFNILIENWLDLCDEYSMSICRWHNFFANIFIPWFYEPIKKKKYRFENVLTLIDHVLKREKCVWIFSVFFIFDTTLIWPVCKNSRLKMQQNKLVVFPIRLSHKHVCEVWGKLKKYSMV